MKKVEYINSVLNISIDTAAILDSKPEGSHTSTLSDFYLENLHFYALIG
jgi:hypothetical protein